MGSHKPFTFIVLKDILVLSVAHFFTRTRPFALENTKWLNFQIYICIYKYTLGNDGRG